MQIVSVYRINVKVSNEHDIHLQHMLPETYSIHEVLISTGVAGSSFLK